MLALFALAFQFVVAFGYVHPPQNPATLGPAAVMASITLDGAAGPPGKHHPAADVFCDVCATLTLTTQGLAASQPVLAAPSYGRIVQASTPDDDVPVQRRYLLARSRAPPAV